MIFTCIYIYIISYNHIHSMSQLCGLWSIYTIFQHFNRCIFPASLFFNCKNQKKHISVPWLLSAVLQPLRFESSSGSVFYGRFYPQGLQAAEKHRNALDGSFALGLGPAESAKPFGSGTKLESGKSNGILSGYF